MERQYLLNLKNIYWFLSVMIWYRYRIRVDILYRTRQNRLCQKWPLLKELEKSMHALSSPFEIYSSDLLTSLHISMLRYQHCQSLSHSSIISFIFSGPSIPNSGYRFVLGIISGEIRRTLIWPVVLSFLLD